jgi:phosphoribosylpyrophosphate synthetase
MRREEEIKQHSIHFLTAVAIGDKTRRCHDEKAEILTIIGEVKDHDAVITDDVTISCDTLAETNDRICIVSAAPLFTDTVRRFHYRESVSELFK